MRLSFLSLFNRGVQTLFVNIELLSFRPCVCCVCECCESSCSLIPMNTEFVIRHNPPPTSQPAYQTQAFLTDQSVTNSDDEKWNRKKGCKKNRVGALSWRANGQLWTRGWRGRETDRECERECERERESARERERERERERTQQSHTQVGEFS